MTSIQPIASTPDLPRLRAFYETVLGATQTLRVPEEGPEFYVELRIGVTTLGLVQEGDTQIGAQPDQVDLKANSRPNHHHLPVSRGRLLVQRVSGITSWGHSLRRTRSRSGSSEWSQ